MGTREVWLMATIIMVLLIMGVVMVSTLSTQRNVEKKAAEPTSKVNKTTPREINVNTITGALQEKYHFSAREINTIGGLLSTGLRDNNIGRIIGYGIDMNNSIVTIYVDYMNQNRVRKCLVFTLRRTSSGKNVDLLGIDDYGEKCQDLIAEGRRG